MIRSGAVPKGTQQPVDLSRVLAFIAASDVSRRSVGAVSKLEGEPTSFGAERIPAKTAESRSVPRSPVRSEWKNPSLSRDLSAFSKLYAKSTDCVAEGSGFELSVPVSKLGDDSF